MIDDLADLAVAAVADVAIDKAAKRHRWVRILRACIGLVFIALVVGLVYITFKYS
jgi:threonine/homoserine/homoserine lactone efflux protein